MREIQNEKVSDKKHIEESKISYNDSANIQKLNRLDKAIEKHKYKAIETVSAERKTRY